MPERRRSPSSGTLCRVCNALAVDVAVFLASGSPQVLASERAGLAFGASRRDDQQPHASARRFRRDHAHADSIARPSIK
jgi:hypothetical protein